MPLSFSSHMWRGLGNTKNISPNFPLLHTKCVTQTLPWKKIFSSCFWNPWSPFPGTTGHPYFSISHYTLRPKHRSAAATRNRVFRVAPRAAPVRSLQKSGQCDMERRRDECAMMQWAWNHESTTQSVYRKAKHRRQRKKPVRSEIMARLRVIPVVVVLTVSVVFGASGQKNSGGQWPYGGVPFPEGIYRQQINGRHLYNHTLVSIFPVLNHLVAGSRWSLNGLCHSKRQILKPSFCWLFF